MRNIPFVSVEELAGDKTNRGYGSHSGVQWHPNDAGMKGYAEGLFKAWKGANASARYSADSKPDKSTNLRPRVMSPLRGFTVDRMDESTLRKAADEWHANSVRYMMRPRFLGLSVYRSTPEVAWEKMMAALPDQLDMAKELGLIVILCPFDLPNPAYVDYPEPYFGKEWKHRFWTDESNLRLLEECWDDILEVIKDRDQEIWLELINEPLDWEDFPNPPKNWPSWAQKLTDHIREVEPRQPIVITAGPGGLCWAFKDFEPIRGDNIIYTTHNYQPHQYTHQGIENIQATDLKQAYLDTQRAWPGEFTDTGGGWWDKARLKEELKPMIDFQKRHNVRIYVSEFGVVKWAPNAADYLRDSLELYEEMGWDWSIHALDENPIWSPEYSDKFEQSKDAKRVESMTERGKVIAEYMSRNLKQAPTQSTHRDAK